MECISLEEVLFLRFVVRFILITLLYHHHYQIRSLVRLLLKQLIDMGVFRLLILQSVHHMRPEFENQFYGH